MLNIVHWDGISTDFDRLHAVISSKDKKARLVANTGGEQKILKSKDLTDNTSLQIIGTYTKK